MFNKKKLPIIDDDDELYSKSEEMEEVTVKAPTRDKKARNKINFNFFKSRLFAGILCVAFAIIMTFVVMPIMESVASTKITVVKTKDEIKKGTLITADMLKTVEVGGYNLGDALTSTKDVIGKYASIDIVADDIIYPQKLSSDIPYTNAYLYNLKPGKQAISISIQSLARGLTAKIRPGDVISIYAIYKDNADKNNIYADAILRPELKYIEVLAISDDFASDIADETLEDLSDSNEVTEEFLPATITVAVNEKQAAVLAGIETTTSAHIALVCRHNNENKQIYLELQDEYFEEKDAETENETRIDISDEQNNAPEPEINETDKNVVEEIPNSNEKEEIDNGN